MLRALYSAKAGNADAMLKAGTPEKIDQDPIGSGPFALTGRPLASIVPASANAAIALFKDGELVYFLPRHRIEGRDAHAVASDLNQVFSEHCPVPAS